MRLPVVSKSFTALSRGVRKRGQPIDLAAFGGTLERFEQYISNAILAASALTVRLGVLMNKNEVRGWLRALAQPTTYLGVAMLAFVFAGLIFLLLQSRAVEEEEAKTNRRERRAAVRAVDFPRADECRQHAAAVAEDLRKPSGRNRLYSLADRSGVQERPEISVLPGWPGRHHHERPPTGRVPLASTFRTSRISRRRPWRPRTGSMSASRSGFEPPANGVSCSPAGSPESRRIVCRHSDDIVRSAAATDACRRRSNSAWTAELRCLISTA